MIMYDQRERLTWYQLCSSNQFNNTSYPKPSLIFWSVKFCFQFQLQRYLLPHRSSVKNQHSAIKGGDLRGKRSGKSLLFLSTIEDDRCIVEEGNRNNEEWTRDMKYCDTDTLTTARTHSLFCKNILYKREFRLKIFESLGISQEFFSLPVGNNNSSCQGHQIC